MEFDKVAYGKLFSILAAQEQAMSAGEVYVAQGDFAGCGAMLILYPTSRPCDPTEHEAPT